VRLAGFALLGMLSWVARWCRPDGEHPAVEIAIQFGDYAVAMLRTGALAAVPGQRGDVASRGSKAS